MRINHNIAALNTHRQLSFNNTGAGKNLEKLSSGFRINRAGDDAAGLAISEKMRGQIRGLEQATRNSQDAISMIQTTEGALSETHSLLQRMRELAVQSSNGTYTESDREKLQAEMNQLTSEINRIGNTTEFNTKSLLKGKNADVVDTAAAQTTIVAGEAGVVTGAISGFGVNANSRVAVDSTATVQGNTSKATGATGSFAENIISQKGIASSVTLANGLTFASDVDNVTPGTDLTALNGGNIAIVQASAAGTATTMAYAAGTYTITVGTDALGNSLATNRGELYNQISSVVDTFDFATNGGGADEAFKLQVPSNTEAEVTNVASAGTFAGGSNEVAGAYAFTLTNAFEEAGDTVTIGGRTFTAVYGTADASKGQFSIGNPDATTTATAQATSLAAAITADSVLGARFGAVAAAGVITLTEAAGKATGVALDAPTVAGAGTDNKLVITDEGGHNLFTVTINKNATDALNVTQTDGNLTIQLAHTTASKNTAEKIQEAIRNLGIDSVSGVDFSKFTVKAEGNWNTEQTGASLLKSTGTLVGGTTEVKGDYSFNIDTAFAAGDVVEVNGKVFTAVASGADASKGQFNVAGGNIGAQAAGLADAMSLNAAFSNYTVQANGNQLVIKEKAATGTDIAASDLNVRAIGTQGQYSVDVDSLLENGAKFVLDGQEITVSNKNQHAGYDNGTAIKATNDLAAQTAALVDAINKNEDAGRQIYSFCWFGRCSGS